MEVRNLLDLARTFHKPSTTTAYLTASQSLPLLGDLRGFQSRSAGSPAALRKGFDTQQSAQSRYEVCEMSALGRRLPLIRLLRQGRFFLFRDIEILAEGPVTGGIGSLP